MDRIFIAEDDEAIYNELKTLLNVAGYSVVESPPCELCLLDVNLGRENGFELCRKIRKTSSVPVIFLTARDSDLDELTGFGVGGDDYIRKPYDSSVLLARIGRLLHRRENCLLTCGGFTLRTDLSTVEYDGKSAALTRNEAKILAALMKKEVCSKEEIIEQLWENSLYIDENTLYVNLSRLREKLKSLGAADCIRNIRNVGYKL